MPILWFVSWSLNSDHYLSQCCIQVLKDAVKNCNKSFVILLYLKSVGSCFVLVSSPENSHWMPLGNEACFFFPSFYSIYWFELDLLKSNLFRRRRKRHFFFQRWIVAIKNRKKCQGEMPWQNILLVGAYFGNDELDSLIVMDKYEDKLWISKALEASLRMKN